MRPLMVDHGMYQVVFAAAVVLFALQSLPALRSTLRLTGERDSTSDQGSFMRVQFAIVLAAIAGYVCATHLTGATITWHRPLIFSLGIAVMVIGAVMSAIAVRQLGRYFTVVVAVRPDQPVVDSGLYRWIRHPSYAGQILTLVGYSLTLTNWASIPVVVLLTLPGYLFRIRVEEQALRRGLGIPYEAYMRRTRRLVPGVW